MVAVVNQSVELTPWQRWAKRLAYVVLTLLTAWLLAKIFWMVLAPEPLILKAPVVGQSSAAKTPQVSAAQYHLFGEVGAEPVVAVGYGRRCRPSSSHLSHGPSRRSLRRRMGSLSY